MFAEEALEYGIIDKIMIKKIGTHGPFLYDESPADSIKEVSVFFMMKPTAFSDNFA